MERIHVLSGELVVGDGAAASTAHQAEDPHQELLEGSMDWLKLQTTRRHVVGLQEVGLHARLGSLHEKHELAAIGHLQLLAVLVRRQRLAGSHPQLTSASRKSSKLSCRTFARPWVVDSRVVLIRERMKHRPACRSANWLSTKPR